MFYHFINRSCKIEISTRLVVPVRTKAMAGVSLGYTLLCSWRLTLVSVLNIIYLLSLLRMLPPVFVLNMTSLYYAALHAPIIITSAGSMIDPSHVQGSFIQP